MDPATMQFVLPTTGTWTKDELGALLVTQATTMIMLKWMQNFADGSAVPSASLDDVINTVQSGLKSF